MINPENTASSEARTREILEAHCAVDPIRDKDELKKVLARKIDGDRFMNKFDRHMRPRYSAEEIEREAWSEEDWHLAQHELAKERIEDMYMNIAGSYEQARPIADSIVRLEQEQAICKDLQTGQPVLIRGNWRMGKTSMLLSIARHEYHDKNTLRISVDIFPKGHLIEGLRHEVASFIEDRLEGDSSTNKNDEVLADMDTLGEDPFLYLSKWLESHGETAFIALDEVIAHAADKDALKYLAAIGRMPGIQIAIVLHRYAESEPLFAGVFKDFKTYFVQPLTREETERIVLAPLNGTPIRISDEAIDLIYEITGGRPMEINNLCKGLLFPEFMYNKDAPEPKIEYGVDDINAIMNQPLYDLKRNVFQHALDNYEKIYTRSMSSAERRIIDDLITKGSIPLGAIERHDIQPLIDTSFVRIDERYQQYKINGTLFASTIRTLHADH